MEIKVRVSAQAEMYNNVTEKRKSTEMFRQKNKTQTTWI